MAAYVLFAARDGETVYCRADHACAREARAWACACLATGFDIIAREEGELDLLIAECDGVIFQMEEHLSAGKQQRISAPTGSDDARSLPPQPLP